MKPKSVEYYSGMEFEQLFGDEMPNFDICGTVFKELFKVIDVLDVDAKTEASESTENEIRSIVQTYHLYWCFPMMQELDDDCESRIFNKYCST